jgi:hypothetical protein
MQSGDGIPVERLDRSERATNRVSLKEIRHT